MRRDPNRNTQPAEGSCQQLHSVFGRFCSRGTIPRNKQDTFPTANHTAFANGTRSTYSGGWSSKRRTRTFLVESNASFPRDLVGLHPTRIGLPIAPLCELSGIEP